MRGLLLWAIVILIGGALLRLLSWSLVIFLPWAAVTAWRDDSPLKWIITALIVATSLFLFARRNRGSRPETARILWLLAVLLTVISVIVQGADARTGFHLWNQPTGRLAHLVAVGGFVAAGLTYWRLIEKRKKLQRFSIASAVAAGALVFAPGLIANVGFEQRFADERLRAAALALELLLGLALAAGIWLSIRDRNNGSVTLLRERWFEFSVILLAAVMGLSMLSRYYN